MNSDEREERLKQIRRARELGILPWSHLSNPTQRFEVARDTLDFLLSLLDSDSQAAEPRYRVMAQAVWDKFWDDPTSDRWSVEDVANVLRAAGASGDAAVGAGLSSPCEADSISAAAQSATAMRDKCVGKIRGLRHKSEPDDSRWNAALYHAETQIQSLTLDQVQKKQ